MSIFNDPFFSGGFGGGFGGGGGDFFGRGGGGGGFGSMMREMQNFQRQADAMFSAMDRDFGSHRAPMQRAFGGGNGGGGGLRIRMRDDKPAWGSNNQAKRIVTNSFGSNRRSSDIAPLPLRDGGGSNQGGSTRGSCARAGILPLRGASDEEKIDARARAREYDALRRAQRGETGEERTTTRRSSFNKDTGARELPKGVGGQKSARKPEKVEPGRGGSKASPKTSPKTSRRGESTSPPRETQVAESVAAENSGTAGSLEPFTAGEERIITMIESDIIDRDLGVPWSKIARLDEAKRLLKEAVVLPIIMPEMFTGIREPWKGLLLYGPPGTGKTLLAKAVATECKTTFFNVSAATLVSRWHGESEKMVKTLFAMARHYSPSVIFFDEIDALMMARGGTSESDATRRLKVEMLQQMDGLESGGQGLVMVLATTNKPWDLDDALRRRLEKRIYIPLPDTATRAEAFEIHLQGVPMAKSAGSSTSETSKEGAEEEIEEIETPGAELVANDEEKKRACEALAAQTEGYSGSDIKLVCREAAMMPMRRLIAARDPEEIQSLKAQGKLDDLLGLEMRDFKEALKRTARSVDAETLAAYEAWTEEFASA